MSDFELFIGRQKLTQFTNGWVRRQFDSLADQFEFQFADLRLSGEDALPVRAGDEITIKLRGELLLTGYVDDTSYQYDAGNLQLTARGRSKTGDLVDSSSVYERGRWRNATMERIVADLCDPFGIAVEVDNALEGFAETFRRFAIEPGEAVVDTIQRVTRLRQAWATNKVNGNILITRASRGDRATIALEYGKNIISGERFDSWSMRHNLYLIKGQVPSDEEMSGRGAAQISEFITDDGLDRYRPLLLVSTGHDRKGDLRRRAQWERNRRAGSGERYVYRVDGYGFESGSEFRLWKPNQLVKVVDPRLEVESEWLLVSAVSYRWDAEGDDGGRTTDLTLTREEAFSLREYPKRKPRRPRTSWWYSPYAIAAQQKLRREPSWYYPRKPED